MPIDTFNDGSRTGANAGPGFAPMQWNTSPAFRKRLKQMMKHGRSRALEYVRLGLPAEAGAAPIAAQGPWRAVPASLANGGFDGRERDSRWRECGNGARSRTRWRNAAFFHLASTMALRKAVFADCPPPRSSRPAACRELGPAVLRQQHDPGHYNRRPLPQGAGPTPHRRPVSVE